MIVGVVHGGAVLAAESLCPFSGWTRVDDSGFAVPAHRSRAGRAASALRRHDREGGRGSHAASLPVFDLPYWSSRVIVTSVRLPVLA